MEEVDLDAPKNDESNANELHIQKQRELKFANNLHAVENKLRKVYFFTEEQIYDIFNKKTDQDWYFFEKIIRDVEQQYAKTSMDIPINDYLYETLMSIEDKTPDIVYDQKYREILNNPKKYIEVDISHILQYDHFKKSYEMDDTLVHDTIVDYIKNHVQEFFLLRIDEESLSKKDIKKLPKCIQNWLRFSEYRGINLYTFVQKNWLIKIAPWVFGWSMWRANDSYFGEVFNEQKAPIIKIALSSLIALV